MTFFPIPQSFFENRTTHVVVDFVNETIAGKKASVELVPCGWLDRVDEKWICYYPPKKEWPKVDNWTKTSKTRDLSWKGCDVSILKEAGKINHFIFYPCRCGHVRQHIEYQIFSLFSKLRERHPASEKIFHQFYRAQYQ